MDIGLMDVYIMAILISDLTTVQSLEFRQAQSILSMNVSKDGKKGAKTNIFKMKQSGRAILDVQIF